MSFDPIRTLAHDDADRPGRRASCCIIMSIYSLTVAFERFLYYRKATQAVASQYAKLVTDYLKQDKLQEAIDSSKKFKNSHVARVVVGRTLRVLTRHQVGRREHARATT